MKKLVVMGSALALGFLVLNGTQIVTGPEGLVVKSGQALAADIAPAPAPAPVGKGKAPIIGKGKGKAPVVTRG
ncbi:MAG TPA: hypothetical protein VFB45_26505 [Pseudolabrys sp.]|nr:hypothetical protein [Pseudolabrys sp.]